MRVKKVIQKIAAISTGVLFAGSTLLGAMAADLSDYPGPFAKDGQFDAVIVVGDKAAAEDVIGAVDVGASLQYALATPAGASAGTGATLQGDVVEIGEPSDLLEVGERIGNVRSTLTDAFLDALRSGIVTTDEGTTDYNQFLRFENNASSQYVGPTVNSTKNFGDIPSGKVRFNEDEDDVVGHYLFFKDGDTMFEYEIEFEEGVTSGVKTKATGVGQELADLEDEQVVILGETYTIVGTTLDLGARTVELDLLGGDVVDTLEEGQCKTYTIDGVDYEVCVIIISDNKNSNNGAVKFSVNGEITNEMADGDTETLRDGTQVGVRDILPNEAQEVSGGDIVEFFLGANEIRFKDQYNDSLFSDGGVKVGQENIEDGSVLIRGNNATSTTFEISSIKYRLKANALKGDVYVRPGHGLREFLNEPQGMLNNNWDLVYEGLQDTGVSIIKFDASGDDAYTLKFTSREGIDYVVPLADNSGDNNEGFKYGDEDNELYFRECATGSVNSTKSQATTPTGAISIWCIQKRDMFVLTNKNTETGFTHVLTYENIDTTNNQVTFTDLGTGQRQITYDTTTSASPTLAGELGSGSLVVGGNTFKVYVGNSTHNYSIAVDLTSNGIVDDRDHAYIVVDGGGLLDLGDQCTNQQSPNSGHPYNASFWKIAQSTTGVSSNQAPDGTASSGGCNLVLDASPKNINVTLETLRQEFDEAGPDNVAWEENISINLSTRTGNEMDLQVNNAFICVDTSGTFGYTNIAAGSASCTAGQTQFDVLKMTSLQDEDIRQGLSSYGAFFEQTNNNNNNNADELTVEYPLFQRGAVVYVAAGKVASAPAAGEGQLVTLNQINVGSAKLASEIAGQEFKQNMILIGGPCINAAAAKIMGSDEPLCGASSGIEAGTAVIKLFQNDGYVSLLVAGYDKEDTRRATRVLANYKQYANDLTGTEVVVKGTSMSDITVMAPKAK